MTGKLMKHNLSAIESLRITIGRYKSFMCIVLKFNTTGEYKKTNEHTIIITIFMKIPKLLEDIGRDQTTMFLIVQEIWCVYCRNNTISRDFFSNFHIFSGEIYGDYWRQFI